MRTLLIASLSVALAGVATPAMAQSDAASAAALPMMGKSYSRMGGGAAMHRWGPRVQGRWYGGQRAPGGWTAYRRPVRGYALPRYWIQPSFFIGNYGTYGLPAPRPGYGWSRYYDDAVMTDSYGRVYDSRSDVRWDRYEGGYAPDEGYDQTDYRERRDDGVGGAAIGAVVGGIAGNRIAGRGNRTEGTLIGAGVGVVAGLAIDKAEDREPRGRRPSPPARGGRVYSDDSVTYNNEYSGRWVGTWYGDDGTSYSGEYRGDYNGTVKGPPMRGPGVDYDAPPPPSSGPHWSHSNGSAPMVYNHGGGGYVSGGYYYPAPTVTTIVIQPATTTTYVEETVSYVPARRVRKVWKPKAKCRC